MTSSSYIPDGWTRDDGYVKAAEENDAGDRLYDSLSFSYRPATRAEGIALDAKMTSARKEKNPDLAVEMAGCEFVAKHLVSWDFKSGGVHPVPIAADTLMRMHVLLFNRVYRIIRCLELSDPKPGTETLMKRAAFLQAELDDIESQLAVAPESDKTPASDADLQKNSVAASG